MNNIDRTVEQIRLLPGAQVDCGYAQEKEYIYKVLTAMNLTDVDIRFQRGYRRYRKYLKELALWAAPYEIPEEYYYFLGIYGGLVIATKPFTLSLHGLGIRINDIYAEPINEMDGNPPTRRNGDMLLIGLLHLYPEHMESPVYIYLDLGGQIWKNAIIGFGPYDDEEKHIYFENNPSYYTERTRILSYSFSEFLELILATKGTLAYL